MIFRPLSSLLVACVVTIANPLLIPLAASQTNSIDIKIEGAAVNSPITINGVSQQQLKELQKAIAADRTDELDTQKSLIKTLQDQLLITEGQMKAAFTIIGQKDVPPAEYGPRLIQIASQFKQFQTELEYAASRYPAVKKIQTEADRLIASGQVVAASTLIQNAQRDTGEPRLEAAELTALQAIAARIRLDSGEAASLYHAAALLAEPDPGTRFKYFLEETKQLNENTEEALRRDRIRDALAVLTKMQQDPAISQYPELATEAKLEYSVTLISEWKFSRSSTTLQQAVSTLTQLQESTNEGSRTWTLASFYLGNLYNIVGDQQKSLIILNDVKNHGDQQTIEKIHLELTSNLAGDLTDVGYEKRDMSYLQQAVELESGLATEIEKTDNSFAKGQIYYNQRITMFRIGDLTGDPAKLSEASALFQKSLGFLDKRNMAVSWAHAQTNLGITELHLAKLDGSTEPLKSAITAFKSALDVWEPKDREDRWFATTEFLTESYELLATNNRDRDVLNEGFSTLIEMDRHVDVGDEFLRKAKIYDLSGDAYMILVNTFGDRKAIGPARREYEKAKGVIAEHEVSAMLSGTPFGAGTQMYDEIEQKLKALSGRKSDNWQRRK
jgi:hypothetical protein